MELKLKFSYKNELVTLSNGLTVAVNIKLGYLNFSWLVR